MAVVTEKAAQLARVEANLAELNRLLQDRKESFKYFISF